MKMKIDKIHILSSLIPLLIYLLLAFIFKIDFENYYIETRRCFKLGSSLDAFISIYYEGDELFKKLCFSSACKMFKRAIWGFPKEIVDTSLCLGRCFSHISFFEFWILLLLLFVFCFFISIYFIFSVYSGVFVCYYLFCICCLLLYILYLLFARSRPPRPRSPGLGPNGSPDLCPLGPGPLAQALGTRARRKRAQCIWSIWEQYGR